MAKFSKRNDSVPFILELDPGDCIEVSFQPEGVNAVEGSRRVTFTIGTVILPSLNMAVALYLPALFDESSLQGVYQAADGKTIWIMGDDSGADKLEFEKLGPGPEPLKLTKVKSFRD